MVHRAKGHQILHVEVLHILLEHGRAEGQVERLLCIHVGHVQRLIGHAVVV